MKTSILCLYQIDFSIRYSSNIPLLVPWTNGADQNSERYGKSEKRRMKMLPSSSKSHLTNMIPHFDHSYKIRDCGREQLQIPMLPHNRKALRRYVLFSNSEVVMALLGRPHQTQL